VQKALIRVLVTDQGQQRYHVSFLVARAGRYLDIEFPAPPANLNVRVTRGEFDAGWGPIDETTAKPLGGVDVSRIAHLPIGAGIFKPTLVDIWYQTGPAPPAGRVPAWLRGVGPFQTLLQPPHICGDTSYTSVRWQVVLPADWIALYANGAVPPEQTW